VGFWFKLVDGEVCFFADVDGVSTAFGPGPKARSMALGHLAAADKMRASISRQILDKALADSNAILKRDLGECTVVVTRDQEDRVVYHAQTASNLTLYEGHDFQELLRVLRRPAPDNTAAITPTI
jgi:hypothetical protein